MPVSNAPRIGSGGPAGTDDQVEAKAFEAAALTRRERVDDWRIVRESMLEGVLPFDVGEDVEVEGGAQAQAVERGPASARA